MELKMSENRTNNQLQVCTYCKHYEYVKSTVVNYHPSYKPPHYECANPAQQNKIPDERFSGCLLFESKHQRIEFLKGACYAIRQRKTETLKDIILLVKHIEYIKRPWGEKYMLCFVLLEKHIVENEIEYRPLKTSDSENTFWENVIIDSAIIEEEKLVQYIIFPITPSNFVRCQATDLFYRK